VAEGWLSRQGNWIVLLVADGVLAFAILEGVALRRTPDSSPSPSPSV
jgi:hypothetical protein